MSSYAEVLEGYLIAQEGLFDKFKYKNLSGMSDGQIINTFLRENNLLNKSKSAEDKNTQAALFEESIFKQYDNDPGRIMAGIEWRLQGVQSDDTGLRTWYVVQSDTNKHKITSITIPIDIGKKRTFTWSTILSDVSKRVKSK